MKKHIDTESQMLILGEGVGVCYGDGLGLQCSDDKVVMNVPWWCNGLHYDYDDDEEVEKGMLRLSLSNWLETDQA